MATYILQFSDDKHQRLRALAKSRHTTVNRLMDEMTALMLAEFDAETRFKLRSAHGAGRAQEGLALLDHIKAAANERDVPYQSLIKLWLQEKVTTG